MTTQALLNSLFQYKAAVDGELLDAMSPLSATAPPLALQSALRVVNHAHIVDRIFAANLQRHGHSYAANWSNDVRPLTELSAAIREIDVWYVDYMSRVTAEELQEMIDFTFTDGGHGRMSREEMLAHVITHSGYHRGEVGRLLPQIESTGARDVYAGYLHRAEPERRRKN
jgi:uncharacterized damage-inducible protein DinB